MDRREHLRGENATGNPRAVDYREHQRAGETRGKQEAMKINRLCIHSVLPNRMDRRIKLQLSASEQKKYWTVRSSCSLCNSIRHRRFRRCTEFHTEFCPKEDLQHPSDDKYTARSNWTHPQTARQRDGTLTLFFTHNGSFVHPIKALWNFGRSEDTAQAFPFFYIFII